MFIRTMMFAAPTLLIAATASAQLTDNTFTPTSNIWNSDSHWSLGHKPRTSERAIIPQGKTCTVDDDPNPDNTAGAVDVKGTLVVSSTGKLVVGGDLTVFDNNSGADGVLTVNHLLEVQGELKVESNASGTISDSGTELTADHIYIRDGGTMTVSGSGKLTLTDATNTRSRIYGTLDLSATLYIADNHTIRGDDSGDIVMSGYGLIDGPSNKTLTIDGVGGTRATSLTIHGSGEIKVPLMNKAYVVADNGYQPLILTTTNKDSTTAGHWMAEGDENALLWIYAASTITGGGWWELIDDSYTATIMGKIWVDSPCPSLSGDVVNKNGEMCIGNIFCTTGDLTLKSVGEVPSEPYIHVFLEHEAHFAVPSTSTCSGS